LACPHYGPYGAGNAALAMPNRTCEMDLQVVAARSFADASVALLGNSIWLIVIVSLCVGILEAVLLQRWYEVRPVVVRWTGRHTVAALGMDDAPEEWSVLSTVTILLANVVTGLLGWQLFMHQSAFRDWLLGSKPLEKLGLYFVSLWLISFVVSAVVEWPFFSRAVKDRPLSREGLAVCLGCNIISTTFMLVWF